MTMFATDMTPIATYEKGSVHHVARGFARGTLQQEYFWCIEAMVMSRMMRMSMKQPINEPPSCSRQNVRPGQVLPGREFWGLQTRTAEPEWRASRAWHSATIRAECITQQRIASAKLKWQLTQVGSDAIAGKRQSVASVPHQVGSYERLRHIVGKSEEPLGTPHESV